MAVSRSLLPVFCLLGLACTAYAQNLTSSTPVANLTLMTQDMNNFTNVALPAFPCDSVRPGVPGGYSTLDLDDDQTATNLGYVLDAVYSYYQYATANLSDCSLTQLDEYNISNACSQVVAGTNYAVEFEVVYDCLGLDTDIYSTTYAPLRSTVFVPLQDAAFQTRNQIENGPQIKDIWFFQTPEVYAENVPEEEPSPEEESPSEEAPAPESSSNTTTQLLNPGADSNLGLGSSSNQLAFGSPAASSSPSPATGTANTSSPEPQIVSGFDVAAQNRSITSG